MNGKKVNPVAQGESEAILRAFPCISLIKDGDLREKVIRVWTIIWRESQYETLEEAPALLSTKKATVLLVPHTNATVTGAVAFAGQLAEESNIHVNMDVLVAAALLHDVDKLVMYERKPDGEVTESALARLIPHGTYGAHIAMQEGVPTEIAHIIATHAQVSSTRPQSMEGIIVEHADIAKLYCQVKAQGGKIGH